MRTGRGKKYGREKIYRTANAKNMDKSRWRLEQASLPTHSNSHVE
jgi:hypothetical protein